MIKTFIAAITLAAVPAAAEEFRLNRLAPAEIAAQAAAEVPAPRAERLAVSEIENRWIAALHVAAQRLGSVADTAAGIAPHAAPAGYAVSLDILARRAAASVQKMNDAYLAQRWHVIGYEAGNLDRVAADVRGWAAEARAHHNAKAIRAAELAAAGEDMATALRWLRADSGGLMRRELLPAVMPFFKFGLSCSTQDKAVTLEGSLSRKGGDLRVASQELYAHFGGEGENLRFFPEPVYTPERAGFLSADSAFFNLTLEMPAAALASDGEFRAELLVSFGDESERRFPLDCAARIIR